MTDDRGVRMELDADTVRRELRLGGEFEAFLAEMATMRPVPGGARLPDAARAAELLNRLRVTRRDKAEAVAALPDPDRHPALWWLLERCRHRLVSDLGGYEWPEPWPVLPRALGAPGRWFYLAVLLATLPDVRRYHAELGVPDDVSWATLRDVGEKVALHRRFHGVGGLDRQDWFTQHFRGALYALGRLQFHLRTGPAAGTLALETHIPETGPLTPAACDDSLRRAPEFFARHFGAHVTVATCRSWLLDDQLADYLPASSNIVRFQRRFQLAPDSDPGDSTIIGFVFRRTDPDLAELPQHSTLERAVVAHLRSGRHWRVRSGWLDL